MVTTGLCNNLYKALLLFCPCGWNKETATGSHDFHLESSESHPEKFGVQQRLCTITMTKKTAIKMGQIS